MVRPPEISVMKDQIEEIKSKLNIVDYLGTYIQLKKAGRNYKAICPFHKERSPSFMVSADRQTWHCFGACQTGGDIISFCMKWENITFYEALKELADKAGVVLEDKKVEDREWQEKELFLKINTLAAEFFHYILKSTPFGETALDYLVKRGVNSRIMDTFKLGYAPSSWDSLLKFLKKKGYTEEQMMASGMIIKNESGRYYDRFRGRIMFPIRDIRNNIIGFSGRILQPDPKSAKYVNTPETYLYHKRQSLYGIDLAKDGIRKEGFALLVEGEFDVIIPYQHGISNVVAIKGSVVTREQLEILKRYTNKIYLALDADTAGQEAIRRGIEDAEEKEFEVHVVKFTDAKDADEAVRKDFVAFKKALKNPIPVYDFLINLSMSKHDSTDPFSKKYIGDEIVPFLARIQNPIIKSHYIKKLAKVLEVGDESVVALIEKFRKQQTMKHRVVVAENPQQAAMSREEMMQKHLLSYIFQLENPYTALVSTDKYLAAEDFTVPAYGKIFSAFHTYRTSHSQEFNINEFAESLPPELRAVVDELCLFAGSQQDVDATQLDRLVLTVHKEAIKKNIADLLSVDTESAEHAEKITQQTRLLKDVEKSLNSL